MMKRIVPLFLAVLLCLTLLGYNYGGVNIFSVNAFAVQTIKKDVTPELKTFPEITDSLTYTVDKANPSKVYYSGLYERSVNLDNGTIRSYKVYIPSTAAYDDYAYYLAVPDGTDTAEFLVQSGWIALAEKAENPVILCVFEPYGQKWGDTNTEMEYFTKAYADMYSKSGLRVFVYYDDFHWRWMGYGKGGEIMQRYALMNPMSFTSLVVVDGSENIDQAYLDQAGSTCFTNAAGHTFDWPNGEIPVPVWIISSKVGNNTENVINYWKTVNDCLSTKIELADKTYKYVQDPLSGNLMTYDQKVGQVVVTEKSYELTDTALTQAAYDFLRQFARTGLNSPYSSMLTATADDSRFKREMLVVNGLTREWYTSLPSRYTGDKAMPLVIYFHGSGQTGLVGMRQGDWWKYGETQGFITVCPSGSPGDGISTTRIIPIITWKTQNSPTVDEIAFVRAMIAKLKTEYNIDGSRIYITGQSNGCGMTQMMATNTPELFAAAACTGGSPSAKTELSTFILQGEYDIASPGLTADGQITNTSIINGLTAVLQNHSLSYDNARVFDNGIFHNFLWLDGDGTPIFRYCVARGCAHSWRQNEVEMFWNEWFCLFSRDTATGDLHYMRR